MGRTAFILSIFFFFAVSNALYQERYRSKRSVDIYDIEEPVENKLPRETKPLHYQIEIQPFINETKFKGRVRINVTWIRPTEKIVLNVGRDLEIVHANVKFTKFSNAYSTPEELSTVSVVQMGKGPKISWYTINFNDTLMAGANCEIDITYYGNMSTTNTAGLFRNDYIDGDGKSHTFLATYMKRNNARKVYPSFDGFTFKATYQLSLIYPKNMTALSNMPVVRETDVPGEPNLTCRQFAQSPEMQTNQLAFVIFDFESITPTNSVDQISKDKFEIRVWGRKGYVESLKQVPDKIVRIVNYLQTYFNSTTGLTKLDVVAMPKYDAAKASDNWGLMFFKESDISSPLIWNTAYEIIHQWIGQSTTPVRSTDALMGKAFSSFLASMTTMDLNPDELEGKWPMTVLYSLYYGYGKSVRSNGFGIIKDSRCAKYELLFRMFNYTLGMENFRAGIRSFIENIPTMNHHIGPRTYFYSDFYKAMNEVANRTGYLPAGTTLSKVADPWIDQDRLPLVTVKRDYDTGTINITQKRYLREGPSKYSNYENGLTWYIPLVMISQERLNLSNTKPTVWLLSDDAIKRNKKGVNVTMNDFVSSNSFIIVNPEEIGPFPVNYDSLNWRRLSEFLQGPDRERIPPLTRAKLFHDSWNLAYANELCFDIALNMTLFLKNERNHVVWEPVFTMIDHIGRRIQGSDIYVKFQAYIRSLLKPLYTELSESEQVSDPSWKTHMRGLSKIFLCRAGYEPCILEARKQFKKWLTDEEPDKGNPVANEFLCPVFKWGTTEEWEFGLQRVINFPQNNERKQSERTYLLKTLAGCPKDCYKIRRLLQVTIIEQNPNISTSDIHLIASTLTGSATGYTTLFDFLADHWDVVKTRFAAHPNLWNRIINTAISSFNTQEGYEKVAKLYASKQEEFKNEFQTIIEEALENIKRETQWSEKNFPVINAWLDTKLTKQNLEQSTLTSTNSSELSSHMAG
ncbi:aminopeptidase N isoform X2 [Leptopilina boulardi]|uniref:aminopeptidase N isoform X2 n=1 Tax=Leptopilina boulardi TaxID=63433 RepID=UPI0021F50A4D|nr:aminopeptidase N isoform X2 [Leptopilina boulardi]